MILCYPYKSPPNRMDLEHSSSKVLENGIQIVRFLKHFIAMQLFSSLLLTQQDIFLPYMQTSTTNLIPFDLSVFEREVIRVTYMNEQARNEDV